MKWIKRGIMIAVGLAIVAGIAWGFVPQPVPSEFATAVEGHLRVTIDEEGITRVKDRFVVTSPLNGTVDRIELEVGDVVEAGDVITTLRPSEPQPLDARALKRAEAQVSEAEAALKQSEAGVRSAKVEFDFAARELERLRGLAEGNRISQEQVDAAETRRDATEAALDSARFARQAAEYRVEAARAALIAGNDDAELAAMPIRSPVDGRVLRVFREHEGAVQAGESLVEVGNPRSLEIVTDLLSRDAVRVRPGMEVRIERWGGGETLEGEVRAIEPVGRTEISALGVEEQRVNVIVDFTSGPETWSRLGDGYRVEARVVVVERPNVVKVPGSAIFNTADGPALFKVSGGRAQLVQVEIGERTGIEAEVREGASPGETVIVHPGDDVKDGTPVEER